MVQWLRLRTPNTRGRGSVPSQGIRSHVLQLRRGTDRYTNRHLKKKKKTEHKTLLELPWWLSGEEICLPTPETRAHFLGQGEPMGCRAAESRRTP